MSNLSTAELQETLKPKPGLNCLITAGNSFRSDDGLGPYIASRLKNFSDLEVFNAGDRPEDIIDEVISKKPSHMTVIDAANFGGAPGEIMTIPEDRLAETSLSTHRIPLNVITKVIQSEIETQVTFLGVQPKEVGLGEGLSKEVKETADQIINAIKKEHSK